MRNVFTKRQRARIVNAFVERMLRYDPIRSVQNSARLSGMNDILDAILIDRERGADWAEFDSIADEINARVETSRAAPVVITDSDIGQLAETQAWVEAQRA